MSAESRHPAVSATLIASTALIVSLIAAALVVSNAYVRRGEQPYRESKSLEVTGSARERIRSDQATWTIIVAGEAKGQQEAYEKLAAADQGVRTFLSARGFPEAALGYGSIETVTHYRVDEKGRETRDVTSYELRRSIHVSTPDVGRVADAAGAVTELLKTGARVESLSPAFIYTGLAELKIRMIGEATANARARAASIAEKSGCRLGEVRRADAGVLQITRPWSTEVSSGGISDTTTIEKDVTSVVHVTFMIER